MLPLGSNIYAIELIESRRAINATCNAPTHRGSRSDVVRTSGVLSGNRALN